MELRSCTLQLWLDEITKIISAIDKKELHPSMSSELQLAYKLKETYSTGFHVPWSIAKYFIRLEARESIAR